MLRLFVILALPLVACIPGQRASYRVPTGAHRDAVVAAGVRRVELVAGVGDVRVTSDGGDSIRYDVALRSQDERRLREECVPRSRVERLQEAGVLRLRLQQDTRDRCGEVWTVRLPVGVAAHVEGSVTNVAMDGTFGAVRVRLSGPGSLRGTLASPSIDAELGHGPIELTATRESWRRISVDSDNGRAQLTFNGMQIPSRSRPPGAEVSIEGEGDGEIRLKSRLGNVRLTAGRGR
jgi:hypothetical protein